MLHVNNLVGFGGGGENPVSFVSAGAGTNGPSAGASINVAYPSGIIANDLLVLHVYCSDGASAGIDAIASFTQINTIASGVTRLSNTYYKVATGSESGTLNVTGVGDAVFAGRMYLFRGALSSGTPYEASGTNSQGAGTTVSQISITTLGVNRLCLHFISLNASTTITDFTGETGGDYAEAVSEYNATGCTMQLQTAFAPAVATIASGSATVGTSCSKLKQTCALIPK